MSWFVFIYVFFFVLCSPSKSLVKEESEEQFTEELLLRPLPDRKVLAHFHFESRAPPTFTYGRHHHIFPKAIYQLVHKFRIREMELSFTQGRWNYEGWGGRDPISSSNVKPPGVELWAMFDVPHHDVDASWKNLTHALSGLFCASINFLEHSTTYSSPEWGYRPFSLNLRYGTLPREAVCTENLTPWLKLLPCRDKAGLSTLMDRRSIYRSFYHSQRLHLISSEYSSVGLDTGILLEQTLTVVLQPVEVSSVLIHSGGAISQPSWSLSSLFGREVTGRCVIAKSSTLYVQLERHLVSVLKKQQRSEDGSETSEGSWKNLNFELSASPDRVIKEVDDPNTEGSSIIYGYSIEDYSELKPFDLEFRWKSPLVWSCPEAPLHASRFLMGSGNERGAIAISLRTTESSDSAWLTNIDGKQCRLRVVVFQVVPWYVKIYYHTLCIFVDEQLQSIGHIIEKMHVSPSEDKVSPGVLELILNLPCGVKSAMLILDFDKGFLHIDEYPPDANQGFDIPSAVVSFPDFQSSMHFEEDNSLNKSPILCKLKEGSPVLSYTEVLLSPLTTPDFSMPYNVITITCTVFALYFGSLLNALRRRVNEEERLLKDKAARKPGRLFLLLSKLSGKLRRKPSEPYQPSSSSQPLISCKMIVKVILIAGVAAAWQYYFG